MHQTPQSADFDSFEIKVWHPSDIIPVMEWTEKPTAYGLYWFRDVVRSNSGTAEYRFPEPILVIYSQPKAMWRDINNLGVIALETLETHILEHWDGEWAGPFEPPKE